MKIHISSGSLDTIRAIAERSEPRLDDTSLQQLRQAVGRLHDELAGDAYALQRARHLFELLEAGPLSTPCLRSAERSEILGECKHLRGEVERW